MERAVSTSSHDAACSSSGLFRWAIGPRNRQSGAQHFGPRSEVSDGLDTRKPSGQNVGERRQEFQSNSKHEAKH